MHPVPTESISNRYLWIGCLGLAVTGILMLFAVPERLLVLEAPDAVLGLSNRVVLLVLALLHLGVAACILATRSTTTRAVVLLWLGLNSLVYRVGLSWVGVAGPPPILEAVGLKFGIRPASLDAFWKGFIAYLTLVSAVVLVSEFRRLKRKRAQEFMKRYLENRKKLQTESGVSGPDAND